MVDSGVLSVLTKYAGINRLLSIFFAYFLGLMIDYIFTATSDH